MKLSTHLFALGLTLGLLSVGALAQAAEPHPAVSASSAAALPWIDGEVRKIDLQQGTATLRHGDITNLRMPGMTMAFKASSPKLLEGLKPGDKVKFTADRVNGALVLMAVEAK